MSWMDGEIREFAGNNPKHRDLRKIRTEEEQDWEEMYFFHVKLARKAGYPDAMLTQGGRIEFEPDPHSPKPKVLQFKPFEGSTGQSSGSPGGTKFLNPYHFIPLAPPPDHTLEEAKEYLTEAPLHDRFAGADGEARRFSGRIVCRLTTEGPVVVGSSQSKESDNEETEVTPFELPDPDAPEDLSRWRPAIPGSTLRGLVSSMVEAASCSAMRVLAETTYSRRADHRSEALSAVGRVEMVEGVPKLRPLTLSFDEMQGRKNPPRSKCRVFLNGYQKSGEGLRVDPKSFLGRVDPQSHSSSNPKEFWYLDLSKTTWHFDRKGIKRLGLDSPEEPLTQDEWEALPEEEQANYTRGALMIFGLEGSKAGNLPRTKKHEYFLPFPEPDDGEGEGEELLEIEAEARERFENAARAAASLARGGDVDDLPYLSKGRARHLELAEGDLVYYKSDPESGKVSRLAFSAIWRFPVSGSLHQAVSRISPNLVPLHPGRSKLTLAERLFGFVEPNGQRALAGRVRFSHGLVEGDRPEEGWYEPQIPLKILATPKPPSPALYFGNHGYLSKRDLDLGEQKQHKPQGRKVYLHHREQDMEERCHETDEPDKKRRLKMKVTPLRRGTKFLFHVDFHNLTDEELGHLLYALRPTEAFRHKLGLGKPVGLGRVAIDPIGLFFIDRPGCYRSQGLFGPKYRGAELPRGAQAWTGMPQDLSERYRYELEAANEKASSVGGYPSVDELVAPVRDRIPEQVRWALELVGDPASVERVGAEVTYPVVAGQEPEGEHFRWFVANDKKGGPHEKLTAIEPGGDLPTLTRHPFR